MDTAKIEAFLRGLHALCRECDASVLGGDGGAPSIHVGGYEFVYIFADGESAMVDTAPYSSVGARFEHDGEHFTGTGVTDRED